MVALIKSIDGEGRLTSNIRQAFRLTKPLLKVAIKVI